MTRKSRCGVLEQVRTVYDLGTLAGLSDAQLLERFAARAGESSELAFAALVERHGAMVRQVCRGVLRDPQDTADAVQATFLVLARNARGIRKAGSVGPWLHGVALRVAACARRALARRRHHERRWAEAAVPPIHDPGVESDDLPAVVHEEVDRLPERLRVPVVLCYLEGQTCEAAAHQLGIPAGTVKSRLAHARERLRERLERRGLAPSAALFAQDGGRAPMPRALADATARAAAGGAVSPQVSSLVERVLVMIFWSRIKIAVALLLAVGGVALGTAGFARQEPPGRPARRVPPPVMPPPREAPAEAEKATQPAWATLRGRVIFGGEALTRRILVLQGDPNAKDGAYLVAKESILSEDFIVHPETKGVANTFVFLRQPTAIHPRAEAMRAQAAAEFRPERGRFQPHVLAVMAGHRISLRNEDAIGYSVNIKAPGGGSNLALRPNGPETLLDVVHGEAHPIQVLSDIHPWMSAWWFLADNPYFAVSDELGDFTLEDVPVGRQHLVVWQEAVGYLTPPDGVEVDVQPGANALSPFVIEAEHWLARRGKFPTPRTNVSLEGPAIVLPGAPTTRPASLPLERRLDAHERRLDALEKKLDRILEALEGGKRGPG
jgi:RNA polymerase sigma-70 factor (ECF subfamily)